MQPDVKNVSSKAPIKTMEQMKDEKGKPKTHTKTSNNTEKAVNQKQSEPNDLNNKKVRELELVELFRASLDPNVYLPIIGCSNLTPLHLFQGTGLVNAEELKHLLTSVGNLLSADEAHVVDRFRNQDGMVKYELLVSELVHG